MHDRRRLAGASASTLCSLVIAGLAPAAQAAPTPALEAEDIVVTGERLSPAQARERAVAFVKHTGIVNGKESVARWIDPVCLRAIGLEPTNLRLVETRIREIATSVGVPLAKPGCTPNVTVNFVGDGGAFARTIAARDRRYLAEVPAHLKPALLNGTAPIRWWYLTELRGRDGDRMNGMLPASLKASPGDTELPGLPGNGEASTLLSYRSSTVSTQVARTLKHATVVVDTVRAEEVPLQSVAAYAAMVAFAELLPRDTPFTGSILGLFGDQPSRSLTKLDQAFLRELYSLPLDRKARQQRSRIVRALQNEQSSH